MDPKKDMIVSDRNKGQFFYFFEIRTSFMLLWDTK